jgi:hypothetical protein
MQKGLSSMTALFFAFYLDKIIHNPLISHFKTKKAIKMKKIGLISLCFVVTFAQGQNIKLENGKKIAQNTTSIIEMEMTAMGQQMKINSSTTNVITITGAEANNYKATNAITKITMTQEGMGQNVSFDSDKKEDVESEMGKEMGKTLNKSVEVTIDKGSGKATETNKKTEEKTEDKNPFADLMGGAANNSSEALVSGAFFVIPADKKIGDKWTDSLNEEGMKGLKTFELLSIKDGTASIGLKTATSGTVSKEMQGMQIEMTMKNIGDGTMSVDTKSGIVKKNIVTGSTEGTMDLMGQSMPFSLKINSTTVVE